MDPQIPKSFNHRTETLSTGRVYHFVDQIPEGYDIKRDHTLLCVHGFPDLWYGWRHQIAPWVRRQYRVIVPDMLGYGGTDKPVEASEYSTKKLCADLASLMDLLGIRQAVFIGHDWGAYTVGRFALWHPDRISALIMLSVPYTPPSPVYLPIDEVAKRAPNLGYQVYFDSTKSSLEVLAHLKTFLPIIYATAGSSGKFTKLGSLEKLLGDTPHEAKLPSILNDGELKFYYNQFKHGGMFGPLNYYRTSKFRHEEEQEARLSAQISPQLPVLFIWGTRDPTATSFLIKKSRKFIPRLQDVGLEGRGHWLMVEAKDEITEKVMSWLESLRSTNPTTQSKL